MTFPDVEVVVQDALADMAGGSDHVGSVTPPDLQDVLPFIRVTRYGGGSDRVTDRAAVDVDVFTADRMTGWLLSEQVRDMLTARPVRVGPVWLDSVDTITGPFQPPADSSESTDAGGTPVVRFTAAYSVRARRVHSS